MMNHNEEQNIFPSRLSLFIVSNYMRKQRVVYACVTDGDDFRVEVLHDQKSGGSCDISSIVPFTH